MGKRLVIFYSSFVKKDGHGILYRDGFNVFEGIFDGRHRYFEMTLE